MATTQPRTPTRIPVLAAPNPDGIIAALSCGHRSWAGGVVSHPTGHCSDGPSTRATCAQAGTVALTRHPGFP